METNNKKNVATFTHLSALAQYFIPFGGFIFPIIIWSSAKNDSDYVDHHGTQAINFQLSIFLYSLLLAMIAIPVLVMTLFKNVPIASFLDGDVNIGDDFTPAHITGIAVIAVMALIIFCFLKIAEFFLIIYAAVKAANGELYQYPLSINFIKPTPHLSLNMNQ
ncbi:MAG TPA: DUF4870 domain-containing protein [Flavobacterium sp.]|jgi:hypothetical protein|nr:DUF4870 domain-containing protein [Flavobacterium sp.]